ncbi:class I SAM-dependent methyltransferase [Pseudonocardia sp.]|uniref:class I SAM-dependent methyltransferase n=1 Tax=Pseudonocardia sp. TaxID=60912 RepID=UPI003D0BCD63
MIDDGALIGTRKADFSEIYVEPDPRAYYATLRPLDYQIPQLAAPVVEAVVAAARPAAVLDLCCSYGINAALLRHDVTWERLAEHYERLDDLPTATLETVDEAFYSARRRGPSPRVLGLDASDPAVGYAVRTGLLAAGWAEDLEQDDASAALAAGLQDVGLVISTGGIGYVGEQTIERILRVLPRPEELWLAVFVLRVFDYATVADTLARFGLVTEKLPGTFRQRRFADRDERDAAVHDVERRGLDPTDLEADGWYHAECFLTRPAAKAARVPAAELLAC